ncbi:hypothetical protein SLE2022_214620 [Rubroshorea leprosula]
MKSDHVFKELSGSDEVSSETWSLDSGFNDEASEAYLGDGDAKSSRNTPAKRKVEDDDVEAMVETTQVAETTVEHSTYRWKQERQISKRDLVSMLNDNPANVDGSRESLHSNRTEKIQALGNNNHEGSIFEIEKLPATSDTQKIQNDENHKLKETIGPLKMLSPAEVVGSAVGSWANKNLELSKQATNETGDSISEWEEVVRNAELKGPNQLRNEKENKGSSLQISRKQQKDKATSADQLAEEQQIDFWKGFESESGCEQQWMGRRQSKLKRRKNKKKKIRSCSSVYEKEGKGKQEIKSDKRKRAAKEQGTKEKMPSFSPGSQNQAAGESVTDSDIIFRNGCIRRDSELCSAGRIWAFAKKIGVGDRGNEAEVIQRLKEMEARDRRQTRSPKVNKVIAEGNGGVDPL